MKLTMHFLNVKNSPALDERIEKKSSKLEKYTTKECQLKWSCYAKEGRQVVELLLVGEKGELQAKANNSNLYKAMDLAVEKLEKQLHKNKQQVKQKLHRKQADLVILERSRSKSCH